MSRGNSGNHGSPRRGTAAGRRKKFLFDLERMESRVLLATFPVDSFLDDGGATTLRGAIDLAIAQGGANTIKFQTGGSAGSIQLQAARGNLNPIPQDTTFDFTTADLGDIELDGTNLTGTKLGLRFLASGSTLAGMGIFHVVNFNGSGSAGIVVSGDNTVVTGVLVGVNNLGAAGPNQVGIQINGGSGVAIGGATPQQRNVISGNTAVGLAVASGVSGLTVVNDYIGLNAAGTAAIPNGTGIRIASSNGLTIGAAAAGSTVVVSGNTTAQIELQSDQTTIFNTFVGTKADGSQLTGATGDGIFLNGASRTTIGGTGSNQGNLISGNAGNGISIALRGSTVPSANSISGNTIGLAADASALGNGGSGVLISDSGSNIITANTLSSNQFGVKIFTSTGAAAGNTISSNRIGVDAGTNNRGNSLSGIYLSTAGVTASRITSNTIGFSGVYAVELNSVSGSSASGNQISGNSAQLVRIYGGATGNTLGGVVNSITGGTIAGVQIDGSGTSSNLVSLSTISGAKDGVLISGSATGNTVGGGNTISGNTQHGVHASASGNLIGGATPNVISGNTVSGVMLDAASNTVAGNWIGLATDGTTAQANANGIIVDGVSGSSIGGTTAATGNTITGNTSNGVLIRNAGTTSTVVLGNIIGLDKNGVAPTGSNQNGVWVDSTAGDGATIGGTRPNTISGNNSIGVEVDGAGSKVAGNVIGLNGAGTAAAANNTGVVVKAASVTVGGATSAEQNTISGNLGEGILIIGAGATGVSVLGNVVGLNAAGTAAVPNSVGIHLDTTAPSGLTIGGSNPNIVSGNLTAGIQLDRGGVSVAGNWIGLNAAGTTAVANPVGLLLDGLTGVTVGGTTAGAGNTISGNTGAGIEIRNGSKDVQALGNVVGLNALGTAAVPNASGVLIAASASTGIVIGGSRANTISGNAGVGIQVNAGGVNAAGNVIGLNSAGTAAVSNNDGIVVSNAPGATIGGTTGNTIAGNTTHIGVRIVGSGSTGLSLQGNVIGLSPTGTAFPNSIGVWVESTAPSGLILGGSTPNTISGNTKYGIQVDTDGTKIQGNVIGLNSADLARPNSVGVWINAAKDVAIGGSTSADRNVISGNTAEGILIDAAGSTGITIQGNYIGTNSAGSGAVGNAIGVHLGPNAPNNLTIGGDASATPSLGNVVSGNTISGIKIESGRVKVLGNTIGLGADGDTVVANQTGIVASGTGTTIGGTSATQDRNIISGNTAEGVSITGSTNLVIGNYIGTDKSGAAARGNSIGVLINSSNDATIGGNTAGERNVISGNSNAGVSVLSAGSQITGNYIGTDKTGAAALSGAPSTGDGILLQASQVTIGGNNANLGNTIAGNAGAGIRLSGASASTVVMNANAIGLSTVGNSVGILVNSGTGLILNGANTPLNTITGNTIGVEFDTGSNVVSGYQIEGNGTGILVLNSSNNTIGGTIGSAHNTISGNTTAGIELRGTNAGSTVLQGNVIGLNDALTANNPNGIGVWINGPTGLVLDGTDPTQRNTVSGNVIGFEFDSGPNQIKAYPIVGNQTGILVSAGGVTIGGNTAADRNTISGSSTAGINLANASASTTVIRGNWIGLNNAGTAANGNAVGILNSAAPGWTLDATNPNTISGNTVGVRLDAGSNTILGNSFGFDSTTNTISNGTAILINGSTSNLVGGTTPNSINGSTTAGVGITGVTATSNRVRSNTFTSNSVGVKIDGGANLNTVGGTAAGDGLTISSASIAAVEISGSGTNSNKVQGNSLSGNTGRGVWINSGASSNTVGGSTVAERNLIASNTLSGVEISSSGNRVQGNYIGTTNGTTGSGNTLDGILISGASNLVDANVIVANQGAGVHITGAGGTGNTLSGNAIGISTTSAALGNSLSGVLVDLGAGGNRINSGNTISGNLRAGVEFVASSNNQVSGSLIGLSSTGAVANTLEGVRINGGSGNSIGLVGLGNTISGNKLDGVAISNGSSANSIAFNIIGLDTTGAALGNSISGVSITDSGSNTVSSNILASNSIGAKVTTTTGNAAGNSISGNRIGVDAVGNSRGNTTGVLLQNSSVTGTIVDANTIGSNTSFGIDIDAASSNTVSGNSISGTSANLIAIINAATNNRVILSNSISGGSAAAVEIDGTGTTGNSIGGNSIAGTVVGVLIDNGAAANTVGGSNTISGGSFAGVQIDGSGTTTNQVSDNSITGALDGVVLSNQASGNQIGGGNTISGNTRHGVRVAAGGNSVGGSTPNLIFNNTGTGIQLDSAGNLVAGNRVGLNLLGTGASGNSIGIVINGSGNTIGGATFGNTISGNLTAGLRITGGTSTGLDIENNIIGLNAAGSSAVGNDIGVFVDSTAPSGVVIGGPIANTISGNVSAGIQIAASGTRVINNWIGLNAAGSGAIGNGLSSIVVQGANNVSIGGNSTQRNIISGQTNGFGLGIGAGFGTGAKVLGNWIGLGADGSTAVPNSIGVRIDAGAPGDLVFGGSNPNIVSGNSSIGVQIDRNGFTLSGNWIGLNQSGTGVTPNSVGILDNASGISISGNSISGNNVGLKLISTSAGALVTSNQFGFRSDGTGSLGNGVGVLADASAPSGIVIGAVGAANTIGNSSQYGVQLSNSGSKLIGNSIGLNPAGNAASANPVGVFVDGSSASIGSNVIAGNTNFGVQINGAGTVLVANTIGAAGIPNDVGVWVNAASNVTIGGAISDRNIISANTNEGLLVGGASTGLSVEANYIGTNAAGTLPLPNRIGLRIDASAVSGLTIGGTNPNLISGNTLSQVEVDAAGTKIAGNWIGLDASGVAALVVGSSADGVVVNGLGNTSSSVTIGGANSAAGNTIGGLNRGIWIHDAGASATTVSANVLGLGSDLSTIVANLTNMRIDSANGAVIGGASANLGNTIAGANVGIDLADATNVSIQNNWIGTDGSTGTAGKGNQLGIYVHGVSTGTSIRTNLIAANLVAGIKAEGSSVTSTTVAGNTIGLNSAGSSLGNATGVWLTTSTSLNTIGGPAPADRNVISGNTGDGILIDGGSFANLVENNRIGTDATGALNRGNAGDGVKIDTGKNNSIGAAGRGNVISANARYGVEIRGLGATGNVLLANIIGFQYGSPIPPLPPALPNTLGAINIVDISGNSIGIGNVIHGGAKTGIVLTGVNAKNNSIAGVTISGALDGVLIADLASGNTIGPDVAFIDNSRYGLEIDNASGNSIEGAYISGNSLGGVILQSGSTGNIIGGSIRNTISGNLGNGIEVKAGGNTISGNLIGLDQNQLVSANQVGILINNVGNNLIGGTTQATGNTISGNLLDGIRLSGSSATLNRVIGNVVGLNDAGAAAPNFGNGVLIDNNASGNTIGGTGVGERNVISANSLSGISITSASPNTIQGNWIGLDLTGLLSHGNIEDGISILDSASNLIDSNFVSGNHGNGIQIAGSTSTGNTISSNSVGTNTVGAAIANDLDGLFLNDAGSNIVGPLNLFANSGRNGVEISGPNADSNHVFNSTVSGNTRDGIAVTSGAGGTLIDQGVLVTGNKWNGIALETDSNTVSGGTVSDNSLDGILVSAAQSNKIDAVSISGNSGFGVELNGATLTSLTANTMTGNQSGVLLTSLATNNTIDSLNHINANLGVGIQIEKGSSQNLVDGNELLSNNADGIVVSKSDKNTISSNTIGQNNGVGVRLVDANDNTVGGGGANSISGNTLSGVVIEGSLSTKNLIQSNLITSNKSDGVTIRNGASANTIGTGNSINNNLGNGIQIAAGANVVDSAAVTGNVGDGILLLAGSNTIRGVTSNANQSDGVEIRGSLASANQVVSSDVRQNAGDGIRITSADSNSIGLAGLGNSITGNAGAGVRIRLGKSNSLVDNTISGNGVDGVLLDQSLSNLVGVGNVIIGQTAGAGVHIVGNGSNSNRIIGSEIGRTGSANSIGILIETTGSELITGTTIGSATTGQANTIGGNTGDGIQLNGVGVSGVSILGNLIGVDAGGAARPNSGNGIRIASAHDNSIGGTATGESNVISSNLLDGIFLFSSNDNLISSNIVGASPNRSSARGNGLDGIRISGSSRNQISNNFVGANASNGVEIAGSGSDRNQIVSNTIGFRATLLSTDLGNAQDGIRITDATNTTIGGTSLADGNLISANRGNGINLGGNASGTLIQHNLVGLSGDARSTVANGASGILVDGSAGSTGVTGSNVIQNSLTGNVGNGITVTGPRASQNSFGDNEIAQSGLSGIVLNRGASNNTFLRNSVSGSGVDGLELFAPSTDATPVSDNTFDSNLFNTSAQGVNIFGPKATHNHFLNNSIGVASDGSTARSNSLNGVVVNQGTANEFFGNVVSSNRRGGFVLIEGATGNLLDSNTIGLASSGTASSLGNIGWGVEVQDSPGNTLIGNLISDNGQGSVVIGGSGSTGNTLTLNILGLTKLGEALPFASPGIGVLIHSQGSSNTVGIGNVISGFDGAGIVLTDNGTMGNQILGSFIGTSLDGSLARPNAEGVVIQSGASGNRIGSGSVDNPNVISGNVGEGILLASDANVVSGNLIGVTASGLSALANRANGIRATAGNSVIGPANTISGNTIDGIYLDGPGASGTTIIGNDIGLDRKAEVAVFSAQSGETAQYGIEIRDASNITIGGPNDSDRNTISGNGDAGIYVRGHAANPANNIQIIRNYIGSRGDGQPSPSDNPLRREYNPDYVTPDGRNGDGIVLVDSGSASIVGNLISGNNRVGLYLVGSLTRGASVTGNVIGLAADGITPLPNMDGIDIRNAPMNTIGGPTRLLGNVISGNRSTGITIAAIGRSDLPQDQITNGYQSDPDDTLGTWDPGTPDGRGGFVQTATSGANSNVILNNFIGTDVSGERPTSTESPSSIGNAQGIFLNSVQFTTIRSNLISGNRGIGIQLFNNATVFQPLNQPIPDSPYQRVHGTINTLNNTIAANLIGTNKDGTTAVPNGQGIFINDAWQNVIGGNTRADGNTISGNSGIALQIMGDDIGRLPTPVKGKPAGKTQNPPNTVLNNFIGVGGRSGPLPNDLGIFVNGARNPIDLNANFVAQNRRGAFINRLPNYGPTVDIVTTPTTADTDPVTTIHVTFSQYVDPVKAANPANYVVVRLVPGKKPGSFVTPTQQAKIGITASFDVVNRTTTLKLTYAPGSKPITFADAFKFIVKAKITSRGTPAYPLDGTFNSKPGFDFVTVVRKGSELAPTNTLNKPSGPSAKSQGTTLSASMIRVDMGQSDPSPTPSAAAGLIDKAIEQGGLTPAKRRMKH